jgi:hypothetical protein
MFIKEENKCQGWGVLGVGESGISFGEWGLSGEILILVGLSGFKNYPLGKTAFFSLFIVGSNREKVCFVLFKAVNCEFGIVGILEFRKRYNYR